MDGTRIGSFGMRSRAEHRGEARTRHLWRKRDVGHRPPEARPRIGGSGVGKAVWSAWVLSLWPGTSPSDTADSLATRQRARARRRMSSRRTLDSDIASSRPCGWRTYRNEMEWWFERPRGGGGDVAAGEAGQEADAVLPGVGARGLARVLGGRGEEVGDPDGGIAGAARGHNPRPTGQGTARGGHHPRYRTCSRGRCGWHGGRSASRGRRIGPGHGRNRCRT